MSERRARCWYWMAVLSLALTPLLGAAKLRFEDVVANLKSPNASTRAQAATELGRSRRREAVAPLAAVIRDPEPKVRHEVVKALRQLRDLSAVSALSTALQDEDPEIRVEAIGSLVELYTERERSAPPKRFLELFSDEEDRSSLVLQVVTATVYEALGRCLRDEQPEVREQAGFALGILDGRSEMKGLIDALQDPVPGVRAAAIAAVGKIGGVAEGRALIPLLADESTAVRSRAVRALANLRVKEAGPALRELYDTTRRKENALKILEALSRVGDPGQRELFQQFVQDSDPERRRLAVEGLARLDDPGFLPGFKKDYQRTKDEELRLAYSFAIARLGDHAFLDSLVLCLPSKTLGARCQGYLIELGPSVVPELFEYLADPDADVRAELCDVIGASGSPAAIEKLTPLLQDASAKVADRANRAIERLKREGGTS